MVDPPCLEPPVRRSRVTPRTGQTVAVVEASLREMVALLETQAHPHP